MPSRVLAKGQNVKSPDDKNTPLRGRWIRPSDDAEAVCEDVADVLQSPEAIESALLQHTEGRIADLVEVERHLEDELRRRLVEARGEIERERAQASRAQEARDRERDERLRERESRAADDARVEGHEAGYEAGLREGRHAGFAQGRAEGLEQGLAEGRELAEERAREDLGRRTDLFRSVADELESFRREFVSEAQKDILEVGVEIGRSLVKREVRDVGDPVVRNVEKAVDLVFRRGSVIVEVHPDDVATLEQALAESRFADEFESIDLRGRDDLERGGCRLLTGASVVDLSLETQLALIRTSILGEDS